LEDVKCHHIHPEKGVQEEELKFNLNDFYFNLPVNNNVNLRSILPTFYEKLFVQKCFAQILSY